VYCEAFGLMNKYLLKRNIKNGSVFWGGGVIAPLRPSDDATAMTIDATADDAAPRSHFL